MQSFASPPPSPPHKSHTPHKNHETQITPHAPTKKGATIAYTHALSTQKTTERAQLSLHLKKKL